MEIYAAIDLHSSNNFIGVIDEQEKRLYGRRHANRIQSVLNALEPFKKSLRGVVIESTYNGYWMIDGLQENGYRVHLANPAAIKQYEGLKYTDDRSDTFWLARLLHLGILPEGYIYPKAQRALRDLARRRLLFVRQRTANILSLQSMIARNLGASMAGNEIKKLNIDRIGSMFDSPDLVLTAKSNVQAIQALNEIIAQIESEVKRQARLKEPFRFLLTIPGVGIILASIIMLEVGDISRFPAVQNYSSYCRCVRSVKTSNKKKKGEGNRKNGNKYLAWAYVEASHRSRANCPQAKQFYERKKAHSPGAVATKALANKLARASYYIMRDQVPFDAHKLFG